MLNFSYTAQLTHSALSSHHRMLHWHMRLHCRHPMLSMPRVGLGASWGMPCILIRLPLQGNRQACDVLVIEPLPLLQCRSPAHPRPSTPQQRGLEDLRRTSARRLLWSMMKITYILLSRFFNRTNRVGQSNLVFALKATSEKLSRSHRALKCLLAL